MNLLIYGMELQARVHSHGMRRVGGVFGGYWVYFVLVHFSFRMGLVGRDEQERRLWSSKFGAFELFYFVQSLYSLPLLFI